MSGVHPGAVILLHSQSTTNVRILDRVMSALEEKGYAFHTLDYLTKQAPLQGTGTD